MAINITIPTVTAAVRIRSCPLAICSLRGISVWATSGPIADWSTTRGSCPHEPRPFPVRVSGAADTHLLHLAALEHEHEAALASEALAYPVNRDVNLSLCSIDAVHRHL